VISSPVLIARVANNPRPATEPSPLTRARARERPPSRLESISSRASCQGNSPRSSRSSTKSSVLLAARRRQLEFQPRRDTGLSLQSMADTPPKLRQTISISMVKGAPVYLYSCSRSAAMLRTAARSSSSPSESFGTSRLLGPALPTSLLPFLAFIATARPPLLAQIGAALPRKRRDGTAKSKHTNSVPRENGRARHVAEPRAHSTSEGAALVAPLIVFPRPFLPNCGVREKALCYAKTHPRPPVGGGG
jgi:hypothetical protein